MVEGIVSSRNEPQYTGVGETGRLDDVGDGIGILPE